ncbi:hypothetical protein LAZ67_19001655 [Cordylochernes scorpioides]|uniref:Uncharacterized protein n=1 Tax=Cordylochernes scorpioides TaxID=51811 RepID=A0ABY6LKR1_9ARAC|nr:hypothetical protein LAZ67_19001655 [Cordylochernes scorpioides]
MHSTKTIDQETAEQQKPEIITFYNITKGVAINSAVIYKAVKQDGGMARKDFIKQLALQLMRDALNMRNQAKYLSRYLQVSIQKHAGTSSLEGWESNPRPSAYRADAMTTRLPWTYFSVHKVNI